MAGPIAPALSGRQWITSLRPISACLRSNQLDIFSKSSGVDRDVASSVTFSFRVSDLELERGRMPISIDDEPFSGSYCDVVIHKLMLQDVVRTSAYSDAIRAVVTPDSHVIDFGAGTGVLSIFAARAGARQVDAVERTAMIVHAREIARRSGCPEIRFHLGDQDSFSADGPVDIVISEWMGHFLFFESMLEPLIALRNRWLKPDGVMVPARVSLSAALVIDEELYEDGSFLEGRPYGIDFGTIADLPLRQSRIIDVDEHQILTPHIDLGTLDMMRVSRTPELLEGSCVVQHPVTAYGLVGWFDAHLAPDIDLCTGPGQPATHWRPIYFPFPVPFDCSPLRPLNITITPPRSVEQTDPAWQWSIHDCQTSIAVDERESIARSRGKPLQR
jgi:type I protein arginine methyltransferase